MIKQQLGNYWAIGGNPESVRPLFLSLHNRGATGGEVLNLGDEDNFVYFLVTKKNYFKARVSAFCESVLPKVKGQFRGNIEQSKEKAINEWQAMDQEDFLRYGEFTLPAFAIGSIEPELGVENDHWFAMYS
jgi:hypothetical protein